MQKFLWIALWTTISLTSAGRVQARELSNVNVADEFGRNQELHQLLKGRVLFVMGYYQCKHMCNFMVKDLTKKMSAMDVPPEVVYFGIDENEGPRDALRMRKRIFGPLKSKWHFLVSDKKSISQIAHDLSFQMKRDPASGTIIHELGLYYLEGPRVLSKLPDVDFSVKDLTPLEKKDSFFTTVKKFCSEFDPRKSKYGHLIMNTLSVVSVIFLALCVLGLMKLNRTRP